METRACVLYAQEDVRIETREVGEVGPQQVLVRIGAGGVCGSDIHYFWEGGIGTIRVTEPIVMEVCARARTPAREAQLRRLLTRFHLARFDAAADFDAAARIYRSCRQVGVIPRGLLDCLTAAVAWRGGHELLAQDRDLTAIASVIGVRLHPAAAAP